MGKKADYGRGHEEFIKYTRFIINHPAYEGMPDVYLDDGGIQWEAPTNRTGGKFKDTNVKRLEWWRAKAIEIGIDPETENHWKSKTARFIHPTKQKPCKVCGRVLDIRYIYPNKYLLKRIEKLPYVDDTFRFIPFEPIQDLIVRLYNDYGDKFVTDLPKILYVENISIPQLGDDLHVWLQWINQKYIPREPRLLSPGAMANPPDRLDGFHSFNICCRHKEDKGRSKSNLQSYSTDRRVFEYWVDGDWVAADKLMGVIRSNTEIQNELCFNGHPGPCDADHIGPISLGFAHRPEFQLLCKKCNSAKNNRMTLSDVSLLLEAETRKEVVASWFCLDLWNLLKHNVTNNETALRLSKIMRDNRHNAIYILSKILESGHYVFLATLLGLCYADYTIYYPEITVEEHIVNPKSIQRKKKTTKYALEQKARRFRIAFETLQTYFQKYNRNAFLIISKEDEIKHIINNIISTLNHSPQDILELNHKIEEVVNNGDEVSDEKIRMVINKLPSPEHEPEQFKNAKYELRKVMAIIAGILTGMWGNDRYVRDTNGTEDSY